jgi:hypothetical protein
MTQPWWSRDAGATSASMLEIWSAACATRPFSHRRIRATETIPVNLQHAVVRVIIKWAKDSRARRFLCMSLENGRFPSPGHFIMRLSHCRWPNKSSTRVFNSRCVPIGRAGFFDTSVHLTCTFSPGIVLKRRDAMFGCFRRDAPLDCAYIDDTVKSFTRVICQSQSQRRRHEIANGARLTTIQA